jgi:uncharacterized membrane protein YccF (DUF307 family)
MSLIGNLIWIIFGGLIVAIEYVVAGLAMCVTIIGIPWGIQSIKIGLATLMPFGKDVVETKDASSGLNVLLNIIWILIGGIWIAATHLIFGLLFYITIIGIPFGNQHFKLMRLSFTPFGKELR